MQTLQEARSRFLDDVLARSTRAEAELFEEVLDDLIAWSEQVEPTLVFAANREYDQAVVSFDRASDGQLIWSAYPQSEGQTKLGILTHSEKGVEGGLADWVREELRKVHHGTMNEEGVFAVRFKSLAEPSAREGVKRVIVRLAEEFPLRQNVQGQA